MDWTHRLFKSSTELKISQTLTDNQTASVPAPFAATPLAAPISAPIAIPCVRHCRIQLGVEQTKVLVPSTFGLVLAV